MAINLKNTADAHSNGVKILVYGHAGVGKTTLATTMPNPINQRLQHSLYRSQVNGRPKRSLFLAYFSRR